MSLISRREFTAAAALAAAPLRAAGARLSKGVCRGLFPRDMPLDQVCREARNAGFEVIELTMAGDLDPTFTPDRVKAVAETVHKAGLSVAALWASLGRNPLNNPDPEVRARGLNVIRKSVEFAPLLDCKCILVVPGQVGRSREMVVGYQASWERSTAELKKVAPAAARNQVVLAIENVPNRFLTSAFDMRNYVDQFRSPAVQTFLDIGNALAYGYPQDWVAILGSRIKGLHATDRAIPRAVGPAPMLLEGDVDWKAVMAAVSAMSFRGPLSIEAGHDPAVPDQVKKLSAALDKILAMA